MHETCKNRLLASIDLCVLLEYPWHVENPLTSILLLLNAGVLAKKSQVYLQI